MTQTDTHSTQSVSSSLSLQHSRQLLEHTTQTDTHRTQSVSSSLGLQHSRQLLELTTQIHTELNQLAAVSAYNTADSF